MQDWATRRRAIEDSRYLVSRAGPYGRWRQRAFKLVVTVLDGMLRLTPIYALGRRNAVLILHGTTGSGASLIRPEFAGEVFGAGQPLDASRYFIVLPDGLGR